MSCIFKRLKSFLFSDYAKKTPLDSAAHKKCECKRCRSNQPCDFELTFPSTARNTNADAIEARVSLRRACGLVPTFSSSNSGATKLTNNHTQQADYVAIDDYVHVSNDEISLIKNDQLMFIRSNYIDFALVKNMRNNKVGFVPLANIAEIQDLKEKE
jgi:hypothetical protein